MPDPTATEVRRHKDANACLQAGVTPAAMAAALATAEFIRPGALKGVRDFLPDLRRHKDPSEEAQGRRLPWGNRHGSSLPFRFREGEVTVWTGYNKHGKSEVLNHCIVDLVYQGQRALICSLEVKGHSTYDKLLRMVHTRKDYARHDDPEEVWLDAIRPLEDDVLVYDHVGTAPLEDILNVMLYCRQRYGTRHFVLDSLMRFQGLDGEGQQIWNQQKDFMDKLIQFAQSHLCHVHLVCHSKKPDGTEARVPRRYDIHGSSYISNLAFNVIVVWRNRAKHDALDGVWSLAEREWVRRHPDRAAPEFRVLMGRPPEAPALVELHDAMLDHLRCLPEEVRAVFLDQIDKPDSRLVVDAQRNGTGDSFSRDLWFDAQSLQFLEQSPLDPPDGGGCRPGGRPRPYYLETRDVEEEF